MLESYKTSMLDMSTVLVISVVYWALNSWLVKSANWVKPNCKDLEYLFFLAMKLKFSVKISNLYRSSYPFWFLLFWAFQAVYYLYTDSLSLEVSKARFYSPCWKKRATPDKANKAINAN